MGEESLWTQPAANQIAPRLKPAKCKIDQPRNGGSPGSVMLDVRCKNFMLDVIANSVQKQNILCFSFFQLLELTAE